jgi:hypothetical protein
MVKKIIQSKYQEKETTVTPTNSFSSEKKK